MASQVETLRQFRDRYLQRWSVGRAFVRLYYAWSPPAADLIASSGVLRFAARVALWPMVLTAGLFVVSPVAGSLFVASCAAGIVVGARKLRRLRRARAKAHA
jgi:hypothetical protein